jgi:ribosome-binding protein aMBF1 (putative translation factor)
MTGGKRTDGTRGHIWRKLGGKRRKAWKDAYRRLAHGRGGVFPSVVKLGRRPDPPLELDDESREALVNLGIAVRELREQQGLSAQDLAGAAGVPLARIAAIEDGQFDPDFELLLMLADGMRVRPSASIRRAEELDAER